MSQVESGEKSAEDAEGNELALVKVAPSFKLNVDSALAWAALRRFRGRLLLVWGAEDAVIPPTVIQGYGQAAKAARSVEVVQLPGVGHALHAWLQTQPVAALALQQRIAALLAAAERD